MNDRLIISDTSCIIALTNSGQLELLSLLYTEVVITEEVAQEFGEALPEWISVRSVKDSALKAFLETQLDMGEASAIALAIELAPHPLLIDERKGRRVAADMGLKIIGTIGVLILAKQHNLILSIKDALSKLVDAGFRISDQLIEEVIKKYEPPQY